MDQARNSRGEWVPSVPLPFVTWLGWRQCECGRRFWLGSRYRGHYALVHILGLH